MISRSELKERAKVSLRGKYGEAIKITLLLLAISFGIGFVFGIIVGITDMDTNGPVYSLIQNIIEIAISGLFTFGYLSFFLKISRNEEVTYNELFSKTNMFFTYFIASLLCGIFTALGFILLIIPGIIIALSLSLTFYILLDNPEMDIMAALKKSKEMMNGHKAEYFVLQLSFLGWIIACIFTLGIGYLWLIPYMSVTEANFYNKLKEIDV